MSLLRLGRIRDIEKLLRHAIFKMKRGQNGA